MFTHYLTTALRHFRRHKLTTTLNVVCLTIGLICFLAAHGLATYIKSGDRQFPNSQRIYALTETMSMPGHNAPLSAPRPGGLAVKYIKADFPQLEAVASVTMGWESPVTANAQLSFARVAYADPELLKIFALPFMEGDAGSALNGPNSVVINEALATRLFGTSKGIVGRTILLEGKREVVVSAVMGRIRQPSHMGDGQANLLTFDLLISMRVLEDAIRTDVTLQNMLERWQLAPMFSYALLPRDGSLSGPQFVEQLRSFAARHVPSGACKCEFSAIPIGDMSAMVLDSFIGTANTGLSSATLLSMLGIAVLLISCLNYANLAAAQAAVYAKEVGMRRVVGARRSQVITQHLFEAGVQSLAAFVLAALCIAPIAIMPGTQAGDFLRQFVLNSPQFWCVMLVVWCAVTLCAGAYPAFISSQLRPLQALRSGNIRLGAKLAPALLVGLQFAAASFLLTSVLVMRHQNQVIARSAFESMREPLVVLENNLRNAGVDLNVLRTELQRSPAVQSVSASLFNPWSSSGCLQELVASSADRGARNWMVCTHRVADKFFSTLGLRVLAGRTFDQAHADEASNGDPVIVIDRALAEQYGWSDPQQAIGKHIYMLNWVDNSKPAQPVRIVGVVENKLLAPLGHGATSYMYWLGNAVATTPIVRIAKADVPAALRDIEAVWHKLAPQVALKWRFAEDTFSQGYAVFTAISAVLSGIASLAIVIAILGLLGMSFHIISRRTHEIGVRKTLGASVRQVLGLLLRDFSKPVLAANLLAWPLAFLAMRVYLNVFTQQIGLTLAPFAASLGITLFIAWLAVVMQATRAARVNPATVLRYE